MHLLVVSDSAAEARSLIEVLAPAGIAGSFLPLATAAEALAAEAGEDSAILLACLDARGGSLPMLATLRRAGVTLPILLVARDAAAVEREAFNLGVDALLPRAGATAMLPARLRAIRRRLAPRRAALLRCGNVTLDRAAGSLSVDGVAVEVTPCELAVLETLMASPGVTLGKEVLGKHLQHEDPEQGGAILRVFVCRVRRKLAACGADDIIRTVWGVGYRVEAPSRRAPARVAAELRAA